MTVKTQRKSSAAVTHGRGDDLWAKIEEVYRTAAYDFTAASVCKRIVDDCFGSYAKEYYTKFKEESVVDSWRDPPSAQHWRDYVRGAALTLDPLPQCPYTFVTSDVEALYSDWLTIDADLSKTWHTLELACKTLEDLSDVEHRKWKSSSGSIEQDRTNSVRPATDPSATNRDHSSGS
jgi:hypothetical protein